MIQPSLRLSCRGDALTDQQLLHTIGKLRCTRRRILRLVIPRLEAMEVMDQRLCGQGTDACVRLHPVRRHHQDVLGSRQRLRPDAQLCHPLPVIEQHGRPVCDKQHRHA